MEALLLGAFVPVVLSWLMKQSWGTQVKQLVAMLVCLAATGVNMAVAGQLDRTADWVESFTMVYAASQITYQLLWKPSGIDPALKARNLLLQKER